MNYFLLVYFSIIGLSPAFVLDYQNMKKSTADEAPSAHIKKAREYDIQRLADPATGKIPYNIRNSAINYVNSLPNSKKDSKSDKIQSNVWQQRGPFNVGGRTRALALDVKNEKTILAGGISGGMWKSSDAGTTWYKTTQANQLHSASTIAQDIRPGKENTWYYGTGEIWGNSAHINGDGLFKSTDNGESWFPIVSTQSKTPNSFDGSFEYVWRVITNHTNLTQDEVYAATAIGAIYRSTDGGKTWKAVLGAFGNDNSLFTEIAISPKGVIYATLSQMSTTLERNSNVKGIYRSLDGVNWTNITPANMPLKYKRIAIGISPSDENQVYFVMDSPGYGILTTNSQRDSLWHSLFKYTYKSGDGSGAGGVWDDRSMNLPKPEKVRHQMNSQGSYNLFIKVHPTNPDVVYLGAVNLDRSTDGFATSKNTKLVGGTCPDESCWYFYRYPNHHSDLHELVFLPSNPNVMFTGEDGGVHKTLDNMSNNVEWISLNNGYYTTQLYTIAIDHKVESPTILAGLQDNGTLLTTSANLTAPWTSPSNGDGFYCQVPDSGKFYYTSMNSSYQPNIQVYKISVDSKGERIAQRRIDPIGGKDFNWNTPFQLDPNNNNIMYLVGGKILWRNNDLSALQIVESKDSISTNWDSLNIPNVNLGVGEITALRVSKNPKNIVYFGTNTAKLYRLDSANIGNPIGKDITWINMPKSGTISSIATDPDDANKILVSFSNYNIQSLFYSEDGGDTWAIVSGNLEERADGGGVGPACLWVEILKTNNKKLYFVGTSAGLFITSSLKPNATIWQMEAPNQIGNNVVDMIDVRHSDSFVAVGTHGIGAFTTNYKEFPSAPAQPILTSPINNQGGILDKVTLVWEKNPDASAYKLEVSDKSDFSNIIKTYNPLNTNSIELIDLVQGYKEYFWRVTALNAFGESAVSMSWKFRTAIACPNLTYPEDKSTNIPVNTELKWDQVVGATKYHIVVGSNYGFTTKIADSIYTINNDGFKLKDLAPGKKVYWKMSSIDPDGEGLLSRSYTFTTTGGNAVEESVSDFKLNIYPNPNSEIATINYNLEKDSKVLIQIFDTEGKFIEEIINKLQNPGIYDLSFNAGKYVSGTYFVYLFIDNQKFVYPLKIVR